MKRTERSVLTLVFSIAALGVVAAAPAFADHIHTVSGWDHGLGDGNNNNYIVHPFLNRVDRKRGPARFVLLRVQGSGIFVQKQCRQVHCHRDWDTTGWNEACAYAVVEAYSPYPLNQHAHEHHRAWDC